jgi:hypothetical protein
MRGEPVGDFSHQPPGHLILGHDRPSVVRTTGADQVDLVTVPAHHAAGDLAIERHVVGDDPVALFALPLGCGIGDDFFRLRREADDQRAGVVQRGVRPSPECRGSRAAEGPAVRPSTS